MIKKNNKISLLLFGNQDELILENKLSNILMFIGALICFFGFTINIFNNIPFFLNCLIGICGIAYSVLFYLSSVKKITKPIEIPFQIVTAFVLLYNWFTLQGIEGSTSNFFYIGIFALIYCSSKKNYWTTFIFILLISALLILFQIFFPSLIIPYPDKKTQFVDQWTGLFLAIISFGVLTILVKKSFDKERTKNEEKTKELKESEAKYQFIVENTDDILWIMNEDLKLIYETASVFKYLGYTAEEHMKMSLDDYMTTESAKLIKDEFQEGQINLMKKQYDKLRNKAELEVDLIRKDKTIVHSRISMIFIRDEQYRIIKIRGITSDITKRKIAEKALEQASENWKATFDAINDVVMLLTADHNILEINKAGINMLGLKRDDIIGNKCCLLVHNNNSPIKECPCSNSFKSKQTEVSEYTKNGRTFELTAFPILDINNNVYAFTHIVKDITERKLSEEAIYRSKKDWEDTFESITDMITIHDNDYNIIHVNKAGKELLNIPEFEKQLKLKCYSLYHGTYNPPKGCPSCDCMKNGTPGIFELYEPHLDRFLEIRAIPRLDINSQAIGMIHVVRDITKRKQEESDLIRAKEKAEESDRLKSAFLANMSHEIRTPMNGILGFAGLLKENNLSVEKQKSFIEIIEQSGQRMLNTINDIIDISKIESGQISLYFHEININKALEELYNFFNNHASENGLTLKIESELQDSDCIFETDLTKFNQIFTNLINNAIKFTKSGSIVIGCQLNNNKIEFYVKDTGMGIPIENQKLIFERFRQGSESYTRGYEGSGLGLSISKAFVELLGGKMWVKSEVNSGSTFYFSLPNNIKKEIIINNESTVIKLLDLENKNILIVEDDKTSSLFIQSILLSTKANIIAAENGKIALEILKNNSNIDLILMDMKMPVLDGYKTTIEIRKTNKTIPIIAQTAFAFSEDEKKILECGCNAYISKPIIKDKLLLKIHQHINK
ncbi:MAG: PAS domain S-box protein [Bacteroidia bacterium]|nr:PAS domain S-box protein [Bacteroidia bacterium]